MIRMMRIIFCCEEHGTGDQTFPDLRGDMDMCAGDVANAPGTARLRALAKKEGWAYIRGLDYCPSCVNAMVERGEYKPRLKTIEGRR